MKTIIEEILKNKNIQSADEIRAELRQIIQSIVLIGLSKANFFSKASFYGGTSLRIFYGLNRYSEDLDFTLNYIDESFSLEPYIKSIKDTALSYGLDLDIDIKKKNIETPIHSAFAKLNTYQTTLKFNFSKNISEILHKNELIKVTFEVDTKPALGFSTVNKFLIEPEFATINVLDDSSLFAGKIHAILCRTYQNRVKGRDYYDYLYFVKKGIKPNLEYLKNKLIETGKIKACYFSREKLIEMLKEKFESVDFKSVIEDAQKFVFTNEDLSFYSKELFISTLESI